MFEQEYENPATLGDYGEEDLPEHAIKCPKCGRVWNGYDCDDRIEWDCTDDAYESTFSMPTSKNGCRVCAWENKTIQQIRAYIADRTCFVEVLEYLLCNGSLSRISHYDNAETLWSILVESEDDVIRSWVNDLICDYIHDESQSDFIDWIMEGGFDRVCDSGTNGQ